MSNPIVKLQGKCVLHVDTGISTSKVEVPKINPKTGENNADVFINEVLHFAVLLGNRSVMLQLPIEGAAPVKHCTFHYHSMTDNATTLAAAERMARSLGAQGDIENINIGLGDYNPK